MCCGMHTYITNMNMHINTSINVHVVGIQAYEEKLAHTTQWCISLHRKLHTPPDLLISPFLFLGILPHSADSLGPSGW